MTIIALAEQHPELFGDRVVGVGLISTTAGGLDPSRLLLPMLPGRARRPADPPRRSGPSPAATAAVDGLRRLGRTVAIGRHRPVRVRRRGARRRTSTSSTRCSSATPFEVVAEFFPSFRALDKFDAVEALGRVPTTIICGTADRLTSIGHSRKLHERIARLDAAGVRGRRPHGDPRAARPGQRGARPAARRGRGAGRPAVTPCRGPAASGAEEAATVHAVVRAAFEARPPLDPPADGAGRDRGSRCAQRLAAHGGLLARVDGDAGRRAGARPRGQHDVPPPLRRASPTAQGHGVAARPHRRGRRRRRAGTTTSTVVAREELPETIAVLGAPGVPRDPPRAAERRAAPPAAHRGLSTHPTPRRCATSAASLAGQLAPGDLVVLTGDARRRQDDVHPGARRRARRPRRRHLADVRHRPRAPAARSADRRWSTSTPTGSAASTSSTTSTSTPPSTRPSPSSSGARAWPRGSSESRLEVRDRPRRRWTDDEHRRVEITPVGPRWHALSFGGSDDRAHRPRQRHPLRRAARRPRACRAGRGAPAGAGPRPDVLLVTGDVADHGLPEEYAEARAVLDAWPGPSWSAPATTTSARRSPAACSTRRPPRPAGPGARGCRTSGS